MFDKLTLYVLEDFGYLIHQSAIEVGDGRSPALLPQTKSIPVPIQNLYNILLAVAKSKQMAGEGRQIKIVFNQYR